MAENEKDNYTERDPGEASATNRHSLFGDPFGIGRRVVLSEFRRDVVRIAVGLGVAAVWLHGVEFGWKDDPTRASITLLLTALLIRGMHLIYRAMIRGVVRVIYPRNRVATGITTLACGTYILDISYWLISLTQLVLLAGLIHRAGLYIEVHGVVPASSAAVIILMVLRFWPFGRWGI